MDLTSAPVPPQAADDHVRGPDGAPLVVMYADFACPRCALAYARIRDCPGDLRVLFRHFALKAKHPRAPALAAAAEAAGLQGAFWAFHDALYEDQSRLADPHLWARAEALGLDIERFDRDRRSPEVAERVRRDVRSGMRAGAAATPTLWIGGVAEAGAPSAARLLEVLNDEKHRGLAQPKGQPRKDNFI